MAVPGCRPGGHRRSRPFSTLTEFKDGETESQTGGVTSVFTPPLDGAAGELRAPGSQSSVCSFSAVVASDSGRKITSKKKKKSVEFCCTLEHRELCSMLCSSLDESGVWSRGMDLCICAAGSLCCPPETITTLLIVQYKKIFFLK